MYPNTETYTHEHIHTRCVQKVLRLELHLPKEKIVEAMIQYWRWMFVFNFALIH